MDESKYQRIWQTVLQIPAGKVASYGQIADLAG
ncbi:MGMT family protein, partial [Rheinheimera sp.]